MAAAAKIHCFQTKYNVLLRRSKVASDSIIVGLQVD